MKLSKEEEYSFGSDLSFTVSLKVKMQVAVSLSKGSWKGTNQRLKKRGIKMSLLNTKLILSKACECNGTTIKS